MFEKLLTILILVSFISSVHAGIEELHNFSQASDHSIVSASSSMNISNIKSIDCEDCQHDGCTDHSEHCSHHCSGIHNAVSNNSEVSISNPTEIETKVLWYFRNHYKTPFLDPALKPPLHA